MLRTKAVYALGQTQTPLSCLVEPPEEPIPEGLDARFVG
jgi:hypothetical protein